MNQPLLTLLSGIKQLLSKKQDKLTAGENITISEDNTISAVGDGSVTPEQLEAALAGKSDIPTVVEQTAPSSLTLADNTEYYLTDVADLTLTFPTGNFECWISLTTAASGTVNVTLPTSQYIGSAPAFGNGETWEISIKNGIVVAVKVGDGT